MSVDVFFKRIPFRSTSFAQVFLFPAKKTACSAIQFLKTLFGTPFLNRKAHAMSKTSLFALLFTAAMLCGIISMLAKLSYAVESAAASFPTAM